MKKLIASAGAGAANIPAKFRNNGGISMNNCKECPYMVEDYLPEGVKLKSGRCMCPPDKKALCEEHKPRRVFMVWGKVKRNNSPLIKIIACSTRKAAESFIRRNDAIYREMQIREVIA